MEPNVVAPEAPATLPARSPRDRTTVGSLFAAMLLGAFIAISALYAWGAQVAKEERLASPSALPE